MPADHTPPSMDMSDGPSETRFSVVIEGHHLDITEAVEEAARAQTADLLAVIETLTAENREALLDFRRQTKRAESAEAKAIDWRDRATDAEAEVNNLRTKYEILDGGYRALVSRCKKEVAKAEKAEAERDAAMAGAVRVKRFHRVWDEDRQHYDMFCPACDSHDWQGSPDNLDEVEDRVSARILAALEPNSSAQDWDREPLMLTYRNWRGEVSDRTIIPRGVWHGSTEWHPEPQWLLTAWDAEKNADRDFALADFLGKPGEREALIEALKQIYNMGQSAEPCHWNFRVQARKIAAEAVAAAENGNMKAGSEDRSSVLTALAVRDSKLRTKVMREVMAIIAKIERGEMAASDGTPCASAHSDTE